MKHRPLPFLCAGVLHLLLTSSPAFASPPKSEVTNQPAASGVPTVESTAADVPVVDMDRIVLEAQKSVTTIQEAPALITVVTADEIARTGARDISEALEHVPGQFIQDAQYGWFVGPITRGVGYSTLLLRDGISIINPYMGVGCWNRSIPIELVKRVEVVNGPGGVLWGSNAFLGVVNIFSKGADDVNGVEASAGWGTGPGFQDDMKIYVMGGQRLWGGRVKPFVHLSFNAFHGAEFSQHQHVMENSAPRPVGPHIFGGELTSSVPWSYVFTADANIEAGPFKLILSLPYLNVHKPLGLTGEVMQTDPTDAAVLDPNALARSSVMSQYARFGAVRFKHRYLADKLGLDAKAYFSQLLYRMEPLVSLPASSSMIGGAVVDFLADSYRTGLTLDADYILPHDVRVMTGGEVTYEWINDATILFESPGPELAPGECPKDATGKYVPLCPQSIIRDSKDGGTFVGRVSGSVFAAASYRPHWALAFDAGARVQMAGAERPYDPQLLLSGSVLVKPTRAINLKVNYAEGFRPPVFSQTDSAGLVGTLGSPGIAPESSKSIDAEVNTELRFGEGVLRSLFLRGDYSYSFLQNLIVLHEGLYANVGETDVHSVEALAQLRMKNEARLGLSYTYNYQRSNMVGPVRAVPRQWLSVLMSVPLWRNHLYLSSKLSVLASSEDANKALLEERRSGTTGLYTIWHSDVVLDRVPPAALWNLGLTSSWMQNRLEVSAYGYNILDCRTPYAEVSGELAPRLQMQPEPRAGASFFLKGLWRM